MGLKQEDEHNRKYESDERRARSLIDEPIDKYLPPCRLDMRNRGW